MTNDMIAVLANVALTLSFIVALVFGIVQVQQAARDRRDRLTLDALRNFQTRDFAELLQYVNARDLPANREELLARPVQEQVLFMQFAQEMEMLGILVADRYIDLALVDKTLGAYVATCWEKYRPLTESARASDPFLNEYFQWLAERVGERAGRNPRQPFYLTGAA